ncbi:MAG: glycosyl hydrolase 53 family protein [Paludibacteraceae bacterium]|nr:glycosyl hydrolase 53 family protein [Paludibacteraceae bacterium]
MFVGGDISMLPKYEEHGNTYYDINGKKVDVLPFFQQVGLNSMRVRLFVDPTKASRENIGSGVVQDLNFVVKLGKRIKQQGFKFMLDFHYSDSWADPAQQTMPDSWKNASASALNDTLYNYTKRCLKTLNDNGASPDFIQIGNEISYGMLWNIGKVYPTDNNNWNVFSNFLKSASKACREECPNAQIIIHIERSGKPDVCRQYFQRVKDYGIDYDIIGLSYYPFWHNDLSTLNSTLSTLEQNFPNKKIQIVETAYYYQWLPQVDYDFSSKWPISAEGQKKFLEDLISTIKKHNNVNGLYWWFPEENGNGVIDNWVNRGLFDDNNGKALPALYILGDFAK